MFVSFIVAIIANIFENYYRHSRFVCEIFVCRRKYCQHVWEKNAFFPFVHLRHIRSKNTLCANIYKMMMTMIAFAQHNEFLIYSIHDMALNVRVETVLKKGKEAGDKIVKKGHNWPNLCAFFGEKEMQVRREYLLFFFCVYVCVLTTFFHLIQQYIISTGRSDLGERNEKLARMKKRKRKITLNNLTAGNWIRSCVWNRSWKRLYERVNGKVRRRRRKRPREIKWLGDWTENKMLTLSKLIRRYKNSFCVRLGYINTEWKRQRLLCAVRSYCNNTFKRNVK